MDINIIVAIMLMLVAFMDSIVVKIVLPKIFAKKQSSDAERQQQQMLLKMLNGITYIFLLAGFAIYCLRPFS
jgi:hypothetical protein